MAKSNAKKKRLHQLRTTGKDVSSMRNEVGFSTHVRVTKTKKEKLLHYNNKHKKHFQQGVHLDGNAFIMFMQLESEKKAFSFEFVKGKQLLALY